MNRKKTLVIVPAFNESGNISAVISSIKEKSPGLSILVIDDCSTDGTAALAAAQGAPVISLPFNLGIGGAVQTGFQYARAHGYDAAVQFDGDGQHDAGYIKDILEPVLSGKLDLCIGSRFIPGKNSFRSSFFRRMGIRFFSWLIGFMAGQKLTDPTSGFRAVGASAISLYAAHYPVDFPEPESIVVAKRHNLRIGEVPACMHPRLHGSSSIQLLKSGYYMFKVTLAIILCVMKKRSPAI